jgi:ribosomal-protein-alanine N-acetyltransferase
MRSLEDLESPVGIENLNKIPRIQKRNPLFGRSSVRMRVQSQDAVRMKNLFLIGETIYLRTLEEDDCEGSYPYWLNDQVVCRGNSHGSFPYSREDARKFVRQLACRTQSLVLAIVTKEEDRHIGNISLDEITHFNRSAEIAILIGDKDYWGKGVGKEASRLVLDHGFLSLNLHRVICGTFANNHAMKKLALFLGMLEEGMLREAVYKSGRWLDILMFGVLQVEYLEKFHPNRLGNRIPDPPRFEKDSDVQ